MSVIDELMKMPHTPLSLKPNKLTIKTVYLGINDEAAHLFNEIYDWAVAQDFYELEFTKSGGIKKAGLRLPAWKVLAESRYITLYLLIQEGMWHISFRTEPQIEDSTKKVYPNEAFAIFSNLCSKFGVNLEANAITNGEEVKKHIKPPMIRMAFDGLGGEKHIYKSVHHIDFHSSYMGGLARTHPKFKPIVDYLYDKRKEDEKYKAVLNKTFGMFQTNKCGMGCRFAHLAKDMMDDNLARMRKLAADLEKSGRMILMYNTDGIFYQGEIYHGEGEGSRPAEWSNDLVNLTFRMKSAGSYEYLDENGAYHVVQRGSTKMDKVQPDRSKWPWGSIFSGECSEILAYHWDDGIYNINEERM